MGRAVENPEIGVIELPCQLLSRDQKLGMGKALAGGHADFPLSIVCQSELFGRVRNRRRMKVLRQPGLGDGAMQRGVQQGADH